MISASIVLYHTREEELAQVIKSYQPKADRLLFLIDNSENINEWCRKLADENPWIEYLPNRKNVGYGTAHNIGMKRAVSVGANYHLVLNPDIRFEPEILSELEIYADQHTDVVYMLPKVLYPSGEMQYLCKLLPTPMDLIFRRFLPQTKFLKRRNDKYTLKESGYEKIMNPPCLSGCFMFMRVETIKKHQLFFDESFFMYCEDFDLIRRLHRVGKTIYYPYVSIVHDHAKESYKNRKMLFVHMRSAVRYFNKYGWVLDKERRMVNRKNF